MRTQRLKQTLAEKMGVLGVDFVRNILLLYLLAICCGVCDGQEERSVRIVDGRSPREGRVEIFLEDEWGTVSQDGWGETEATVVCMQLGFDGPAVSTELGSADIAIDVPVLSVECSDGSTSLKSCEIEKTEALVMDGESFAYLDGIRYWTHDQNAGVECKHAETKSNVAAIVMNVILALVVIGLVCLCGCLSYRLVNKSSVPKERQAEKNVKSESMAMYSTGIEKDYSDIPEDRAQRYCSINPIEVEPESSYVTANITNNPQQV